MSTKAEENYLKTIFKLSEKEKDSVSTNAIAEELETKPRDLQAEEMKGLSQPEN